MDVAKRMLRPFYCFFVLTKKQKRNIRICLGTILMVVAYYQLTSYIQDKDSGFVVTFQSENKTKLILVYTPWPYEPWGPKNAKEAQNYKFTDWDGTPCEECRCLITFDKSLRNVSDAVLVHNGGTYSTEFNIEEAKRNRPSAQRWVFYTKESPGVAAVGTKANGVYNWTATYRRDSDFFVPYGSYAPLELQPKSTGEDITADQLADEFVEQADGNVNYAKGKDKMATFGVSNHCDEYRVRFSFIRALMKHIDVSVYGKCATMFESNNTWHCPRRNGNIDSDCSEELQRHKFYLAFENSLCVDYITEKYWRNSLERGLVPIVLGGSQYGPELVIPGSFINAADFNSVKDLADYLKYLDKNDTAYNQYFQWKTKYKVVKYKFWLCQLCKALHDPTKPPKIYHKISEFIGVKGSCQVEEERIRGIISRG